MMNKEEQWKKLIDETVNCNTNENVVMNNSSSSSCINGNNGNGMVLSSVDVQFEIREVVGTVKVEQNYLNDSNGLAIEMEYSIPLPRSWVVNGFEAYFLKNNIKVKGIIKTKYEALNNYDDAIASGYTSLIGSSDYNNNSNTFSVQIGNLQPHDSVTITIYAAFELYYEDVLNQTSTKTSSINKLQGGGERDIKNSVFKFFIPQTLFPIFSEHNQVFGIHGSIHFTGGIEQIYLPKYPNHVLSKKQGNDDEETIELDWFTNDAVENLPDFQLFIIPNHPFTSSCLFQFNPINNKTSVLINLYSSWSSSSELLSKFCQNNQMNSNVPTSKRLKPNKTEITFLVDRSGSMGGEPIRQVVTAMTFFLSSLPASTVFQILGFGTKFDSLFPFELPYPSLALPNIKNNAQQYIDGLKADFGGTNLLLPLKAVFEAQNNEDANSDMKNNNNRQVFILTDGEVENRNEVLELIHKHSKKFRVYALGIGKSVDLDLIKGVAIAGKGQWKWYKGHVPGSGKGRENLVEMVLELLKSALENVVVNVNVELEQGEGQIEYQIPKPIPSLYNKDRNLIYLILKPQNKQVKIQGTEEEERRVRIRGEVGEGQERIMEVKGRVINNASGGNAIGTIAARQLIQHLESTLHTPSTPTPTPNNITESKQSVLNKIEQISKEWNIASSYTSFEMIKQEKESEQEQANTEGMSKIIIQIPPWKEKENLGIQLIQKREGVGKGVAKGGVISFGGQQMKVAQVSHSKTGKHGSAKTSVVFIDPVTGKSVHKILSQKEFNDLTKANKPQDDTADEDAEEQEQEEEEEEADQQTEKDEVDKKRKSKNDTGRLIDFVKKQGVMGDWTVEQIEEFCELEKGTIAASANKQHYLNEPIPPIVVFATIIAIQEMCLNWQDSKKQWELVVKKSRDWVLDQLEAFADLQPEQKLQEMNVHARSTIINNNLKFQT